MLRLPIFKYHRPKTLDGALELLGELQPEAMLVAGGTDLLPNMKRKLFTPKHVIGIAHLPELNYVRPSGAGWHIGAGTPLEALEYDPALGGAYPALVKAVASISTPQLRNMGTIGGNLCLDTRCNYYNQSFFWRQALGFCMKKDATVCRVALSSPICLAAHSADTVPVLTVLDAAVTIRGAKGERRQADRAEHPQQSAASLLGHSSGRGDGRRHVYRSGLPGARSSPAHGPCRGDGRWLILAQCRRRSAGEIGLLRQHVYRLE